MSRTETQYLYAIASYAYRGNGDWIWAMRCAIDMERKRCADIAANPNIKRKDVAKRIKDGKYPGDPDGV
jgi:hypothetical protein